MIVNFDDDNSRLWTKDFGELNEAKFIVDFGKLA